MNRNCSFLFVGLLLATAVATTGCSDSGSPVPLGPNVASLQSALAVPFRSKAVLYVSDSGTDDVQAYKWPNPAVPTGTLTGFNEPQGLCTDGSNAYIVNTGSSDVLVYRGGGISPTRTIVDEGEYPVGCSYDSHSGDLAVANIINTSDGAGSVAIYLKAQGKPHFYGSKRIFKIHSVQYDGSGNLFISGVNAQYAPVFAELPVNSKHIRTICPDFSLPFHYAGALGWDGKYIVIGGVKVPRPAYSGFRNARRLGLLRSLARRMLSSISSTAIVSSVPTPGPHPWRFTLIRKAESQYKSSAALANRSVPSL